MIKSCSSSGARRQSFEMRFKTICAPPADHFPKEMLYFYLDFLGKLTQKIIQKKI